MIFQPITKQLLRNSATKGHNSLGLSPDDDPFIICLLNSAHSLPADDFKVLDAVTALVEDINDRANNAGFRTRYRLLNYAGKDDE